MTPVAERLSDERLGELLARATIDRDQYLPDTFSWSRDNERVLALTELQHRRAAEAGARVGSIVDDQYVGPFTKCSCGGTKLELRGKFWCCTKCGASYGEHAGPAASPSSERVTCSECNGHGCDESGDQPCPECGGLREVLASPPHRSPATGVRVSKLEWCETILSPELRGGSHSNAASILGNYGVWGDGAWYDPHNFHSTHQNWSPERLTIDAAKAAAQAHFEAHIRSALGEQS